MNKKISTPWGIVILLVIVLAFVGGLSVVSQCWQKVNSGPVLTLTPVPTPADETAGWKAYIKRWKTYRNEEYGFEIKYPPSYTFSAKGPNLSQQDLDAGKQISGTIQPSYDTIIFSEDGEEKFKIEIFHKYDGYVTRGNYKKDLYLYGDCDLRYGFEFHNYGLYAYHFLEVNGEKENNFISCRYFQNKSDNLIVISTYPKKSVNTLSGLGVERIIDFFEKDKRSFRDVEKEVINWKTYRNEEYGFEIKYPPGFFTEVETSTSIVPSYLYDLKFNSLKLLFAERAKNLGKKECAYGELSQQICRAEAEVGISFIFIDRGINDVISVSSEEKINLFGREVIHTSVGVEGSGEENYLIPVNENKTLGISVRIDDTQIEVVPYDLLEKMLLTLKFTK